MSYAQALERAWGELAGLTGAKRHSVKFLGDEYDIDAEGRRVLSVSCNAPSKEHISVITLHYLIKKLKDKELPKPTGKWVDFRELEGAEGYYPTFKKRTIEVILRKYGPAPDAIFDAAGRLHPKKVQAGDIGIAIEPFENIPVLITLSRADEEFGPDANILFDENIRKIFCMEDIVVLTEILVHAL
ncbi:MAG: DUF3786 domain-containing protein [Candidatus Omnitrophica bacterium]|nr:DUF3786 domain-containing protein [Candidatus Omnitrophota bacterium]